MAEIGDYGTHETIAQIDYDKLHEEKVEKTRAEMDERDLGSILCLSDPNIEYVTNVPVFTGVAAGIGGNRYAILPSEGTPVAFDEACHSYHLERDMPDYVRVEKAMPLPMSGMYNSHGPDGQRHLVDRFVDMIVDELASMGLDKETVGVDVNNHVLIDGLESAGLDVSIEGGAALQSARRAKTYEERQLFRRLTAVIDGCHAKLAEVARPGMSEREIFAECVSYALKRGVSTDGGFICSGPQTWPKDSTRSASDRILRPGDMVVADFFNFGYFGYRSCYYRSFSVGPVSDEIQKANRLANRWMDEALDVLEPGATTKDVIESWPREEEQWSDRPPYIQDENDAYTTFFMNMGHGLGLSLYEPPFFWKPTSTKFPQELEEGMVVALETLEGSPDGSQGMRIEDMILITEDGCENLSKFPRHEVTQIPT